MDPHFELISLMVSAILFSLSPIKDLTIEDGIKRSSTKVPIEKILSPMEFLAHLLALSKELCVFMVPASQMDSECSGLVVCKTSLLKYRSHVSLLAFLRVRAVPNLALPDPRDKLGSGGVGPRACSERALGLFAYSPPCPSGENEICAMSTPSSAFCRLFRMRRIHFSRPFNALTLLQISIALPLRPI